MYSIYEVNDIQDHINHGESLDISHSILHEKNKFIDKYDNKIIHCGNSLLLRYLDLLGDYIIETELTDEEFSKFKYRPKALSLSQYGTTELWSAILYINHMDSVINFNKKKLKLFRDDVMDIIEEILILEEDSIRDNRDYIES